MVNLTSDFFKLQGFYFRILGFDILSGKQSWPQPWKTLWSMVALCIMQLMMAAFVFRNLEDIEKVTDALAGMLNNNLALFKFGLMMWLHRDISRIIHKLRNILTRECESEIPAHIIDQENRREQRVSGFYSNCFLLAGILSSLKPIMNVGLTYFITGELRLEINVPCSYPWDNEKPLNFLLSCVLLTAASLGVVFPTVCIDTLIISLVHNLVALFKTAQHKIQFFAGKSLEESQERLRDTLHLYKASLDITQAMTQYFRILICIQLVMASIHLCVLSYTLTISFAQSQMLFYIVFGIAILVQLYLYCQCGEYLKTESTEFARAIYDSPWYEAAVISPAIGRSLQIAMMRAQRGSHIDGYFFEANMEVFQSKQPSDVRKCNYLKSSLWKSCSLVWMKSCSSIGGTELELSDALNRYFRLTICKQLYPIRELRRTTDALLCRVHTHCVGHE
ncbi:hypothetical protein ACLKA7_000558 [Drosophila subpalustris]